MTVCHSYLEYDMKCAIHKLLSLKEQSNSVDELTLLAPVVISINFLVIISVHHNTYRGQFNIETTLVIFTLVIYVCKVQLVNTNILIKELSTLELTRVARVRYNSKLQLKPYNCKLRRNALVGYKCTIHGNVYSNGRFINSKR